MNNNKDYFLAIFVTLLIMSSIGFNNVFAIDEPIPSGGPATRENSYAVGDNTGLSCIMGPVSGAGFKSYYIQTGDVEGAGIFVPALTTAEITSLKDNPPPNVYFCEGNSDAYSGQTSYFLEDTCMSYDYNCDGLWERQYQCDDPYACGVKNSGYYGADGSSGNCDSDDECPQGFWYDVGPCGTEDMIFSHGWCEGTDCPWLSPNCYSCSTDWKDQGCR